MLGREVRQRRGRRLGLRPGLELGGFLVPHGQLGGGLRVENAEALKITLGQGGIVIQAKLHDVGAIGVAQQLEEPRMPADPGQVLFQQIDRLFGTAVAQVLACRGHRLLDRQRAELAILLIGGRIGPAQVCNCERQQNGGDERRADHASILASRTVEGATRKARDGARVKGLPPGCVPGQEGLENGSAFAGASCAVGRGRPGTGLR